MQLKARIWLWMQLKRTVGLNTTRKTGPTLKQLQRELPSYFKLRIPNPIDAFHPYFVERIIQSHFSGEAFAVGPEGVNPDWMGCQLVTDLQNKYRVHLSLSFL
jgi:hypothetical protein